MSKKSITKEAGLQIQQQVAEGRDRHEVLNEMKAQYFDEKRLASSIAAIPNPDKKAESQTLIYMFLAVIAMLGVFQFLYALGLYSHEPATTTDVLIRIAAGLGVLAWTRFMAKLNGAFLQLHIVFSIGFSIGFFQHLTTVELLFILCSGALALMLRLKLFPHMGFSEARKDKDGNWMLG